ncbi:chemotaxis protein CheW [Edaphobacter flagellatus]|uniref:chemotaxis protein CheW n=1 Tax=Edaphobacter flagellatus TaxID=1933044 RepID=UPI0021B491AF|nr:chemotaxis protein CheW [Edaphobacter flagellatus]
MKIVAQELEQIHEDDSISLCSMFAGDESFGIDTGKIREVLGKRELERVPMAPVFVAGVVPYRGDVLTAVSFRALLGLSESERPGCVLVLEDDEGQERFGLLVDSVGGVVTVSKRMLESNPCTLDSRCKWLFDGAYKMQSGLMIQLDPQKLRPSRLAETGMFRHGAPGEAA